MKTESTPSRLAESLRRYLPAEAAGLLTAAAAGLVFLALTGSQALAAVGAAWGENAGYYGMIAVRDFRGHRSLGPRPLAYTMGNLLVEFGPAEALDSLLLRPALMFAGLALFTNPLLGIVAGKLSADLAFYIPTIAGREVLRRRGRLTTGGLP